MYDSVFGIASIEWIGFAMPNPHDSAVCNEVCFADFGRGLSVGFLWMFVVISLISIISQLSHTHTIVPL